MKKLLFSAMTVCFLSITGPSILQAAPTNHPEVVMTDPKTVSPEAQAMIHRIEEIKAMDFKTLSKDERKALKHELREMKKNKKVVEGVYLSTGAIIIVLLILLLVL